MKMKKILIFPLIVIFTLSLAFIGIGCKTEVAEETTAAETTVAETTAAETTAAETTSAGTTAEKKTFWEMINARELDFSGVELNVSAMGGMVDQQEYLPTCAKEFENLTGCKVNFIEDAWGTQQAKIINDATSGANYFDMYKGDIEYEYSIYSFIEPLEPYFEKYNVDIEGRFLEPWYKYSQWSGLGTLGLPTSTGIHTIVVRKDIFANAGITYPFDSWDTYNEALAKVNDPAQNFYGASFAGGAQLAARFWSRLLGLGGDLYNETWGSKVNSPEGIKAFELMRKMMDFAPPGVLSFQSNDAAETFLSGNSAVYEGFFNWVREIENPEVSKVVGLTEVIASPGNSPSGNLTFHHFCILKYSKNKDAAFCFAAYCTSEERQVAWAQQDVKGEVKGFDYTSIKAWQEVMLSARPQWTAYLESLNTGVPFVSGLPQWLEVFIAILENSGQVMSDKMTPQDAAIALETKLTEIISTAVPPYNYLTYQK